jgi:hypothetical protein
MQIQSHRRTLYLLTKIKNKKSRIFLTTNKNIINYNILFNKKNFYYIRTIEFLQFKTFIDS